MTFSPFLRRAIPAFAVSLILGLIVRFWPDHSESAVVAPTAETIAVAEKRLSHARDVAATVPAKEEMLKRAQSELAGREKGMLAVATAPQAQAQLLEIARSVAAQENPPVQIRSEGFGLNPLGDAYGQATASIAFDCHVEQLMNILAGIASRPELVAATDLHVSSNGGKEKIINVRLTLSAVVMRKLLPERRT